MEEHTHSAIAGNGILRASKYMPVMILRTDNSPKSLLSRTGVGADTLRPVPFGGPYVVGARDEIAHLTNP